MKREIEKRKQEGNLLFLSRLSKINPKLKKSETKSGQSDGNWPSETLLGYGEVNMVVVEPFPTVMKSILCSIREILIWSSIYPKLVRCGCLARTLLSQLKRENY